MLEILGPLGRRDDQRDRTVGLLAAVQQPQRFGDPPRILVILNGDRLAVEVGLRVLGRMLAVGDRDRAEVATGAPDRCIQRLAIIATCAAGVDNPCG